MANKKKKDLKIPGVPDDMAKKIARMRGATEDESADQTLQSDVGDVSDLLPISDGMKAQSSDAQKKQAAQKKQRPQSLRGSFQNAADVKKRPSAVEYLGPSMG